MADVAPVFVEIFRRERGHERNERLARCVQHLLFLRAPFYCGFSAYLQHPSYYFREAGKKNGQARRRFQLQHVLHIRDVRVNLWWVVTPRNEQRLARVGH